MVLHHLVVDDFVRRRLGFPHHFVSRLLRLARRSQPRLKGHLRRPLDLLRVAGRGDRRFFRQRQVVFNNLKRSRGDAQVAVVGGTGHRVGQAHERLCQPVHPLGDEFRVQELMGAEQFHAVEDAGFYVREVPASASQPEQRVVVRRPRSGRQSEPGAQPVVIHGTVREDGNVPIFGGRGGPGKPACPAGTGEL